ncbi:MAG TPA: tryptophan--tRNA ligase [Candidatus Paceibacterota bacterium]|nr:tryptophan--tRNA ligase [Candidatus Paceibacterota bacterium]
MAEGKKRLFTGLQPSGILHIGNYFGALKPFVDTYGEYDSMLMVADYHSLTSLKDPKALRENIIDVVRSYLAAGVDPEKAIIFKQSDIQEHTELAWIFETLVTVPFLELAHAYKDKVAKGLEANAGLFNYPMLMAADILLYDTDVVPVGADQKQHVEYAREAASKFNNAYGETFKEPKEVILESVGTVPGTDGQKMSKSYKNTIPLFGSKEEIAAAVMGIVTDSSGERPANVYAIHKLFKTEAELEPLYGEKKGKYKDLKEALIEDIEAAVAPMRSKYNSINEDEVKRVLKNGAEKARALAQAKMKDIKEKIGVTI